MAATISLTKSFTDLPGELRNQIYHTFFERILERTMPVANSGPLPINYTDIQYAPASTFKPITGLFLTSRQVSKEARTLYHVLYFPRRHYIFHSRQSIYSFSQMPGHWAENIHQIHLTAHGVTQGRKILNPVKVALAEAARAKRFDPATRLKAPYLNLEDDNTSWMLTRRKRIFTANLQLDSVPLTLRVYQCESERFDVLLPLGKLDWTLIQLMRYTEDYAWQQHLARRSRLLLHNESEIPLRQMPADTAHEPYEEEANAAFGLMNEMAMEIVQALGLLVTPKLATRRFFE